MAEKLEGYKVFNSDWTCKEFQFEVGKEYIYDGDIKHCKSGFHFCLNLSDCFNYYSFNPENKVAKVIATDKWITDDNKTVCNKIFIEKEIKWAEVLEKCNLGKNNTGYLNSGDHNSGYYNSGDHNSGYYNSGDYNSGYYNSGDYNSGDHNSGDYNSGNLNSGDHNSGYYNSGDHNSGYYNSGDHNSGDHNSGDYNSGEHNSGDYNSGNLNSGFFNSDIPKHPRLFNKESNESWSCINNVNKIIRDNFYEKFNVWILAEDMTDSEKEENPSYKTTGGYLRTCTYKEAWVFMWENISDKNKQTFLDLPNFDADVFKEITGIEV